MARAFPRAKLSQKGNFMKASRRITLFTLLMLLVGVLALSSCSQNTPTPPAEITVQAAMTGRATLTDGTTRLLTVSPERGYPGGAWYGRCRIGANIVRCSGYFISTHDPQFHTEWLNGSMDGNYSPDTGQITGTIAIGRKTGTFYLQ